MFVVLTSISHGGDAPGNVLLPPGITGLPKDSVANVSQIVTLDKGSLVERVKKLPAARLDTILNGIAIVFGK